MGRCSAFFQALRRPVSGVRRTLTFHRNLISTSTAAGQWMRPAPPPLCLVMCRQSHTSNSSGGISNTDRGPAVIMKLFSVVLLTSLVLSIPTRGAIDFTPITTERVLAGVTFTELNFSDDGRRITYEQPRGWTSSGGGPSIRFF